MTADSEVPSGNTPLDIDTWEKEAKRVEEYAKIAPFFSEFATLVSKRQLALISELRKFQQNSIKWDTLCSELEERLAAARETIESYVGIMSRAELLASTREERLRSVEEALNQINTCPLEGDCHLCHEIALAHFAKYASDEGENNSKE